MQELGKLPTWTKALSKFKDELRIVFVSNYKLVTTNPMQLGDYYYQIGSKQ